MKAIRLFMIAALAAALGSGAAGCKKKKPQEPEKKQGVQPSAGPAEERRAAPDKPVAPDKPAAGDTGAGTAAGAGTGTRTDAGTGAGTGTGAAAPAETQPRALSPWEAREAAAKAPPELVERGEVLIGVPDVGPGRSAETVTSLIQRVRAPIAACHKRAIREDPNLAGTTVFDLVVDQRGVVSSWTVDGSLDSELSECVANRLRGLRFGTADGETRIRVPIRFGKP